MVLSNQKRQAVSGTVEIRPESAVALGAHAFRFEKLAPGAARTSTVEARPIFPDRDDALTLRALVTTGERMGTRSPSGRRSS